MMEDILPFFAIPEDPDCLSVQILHTGIFQSVGRRNFNDPFRIQARQCNGFLHLHPPASMHDLSMAL